MIAKTFVGAVVDVDWLTAGGNRVLPSIKVVEPPEVGVKDSRDGLRSAMISSGFGLHPRRTASMNFRSRSYLGNPVQSSTCSPQEIREHSRKASRPLPEGSKSCIGVGLSETEELSCPERVPTAREIEGG
ncbi:hypothetical protein KGY64_01775 [Candidatus Bipolaricaulota bacterium]|nr:hypothetical protein [Candidatus Bipolaricaulota bacterium]